MSTGMQSEIYEAEAHIAQLQAVVRQALQENRLSAAATAAQECRAAVEAHFGKKHPVYASSLNNHAFVLKQQGKEEEALPLYEEALKVRVVCWQGLAAPGRISLVEAGLVTWVGRPACITVRPAVAAAMTPPTNTALTMNAAAPRARSLASQVYEAVVGEAHPSTAAALSNLGLLHLSLAQRSKGLDKMNHVDIARTYLDTALATRQRTLATDNPLIAISMYQVASAARMQKRFSEGEKLLVESVAMLRRGVGSRHASTATALNNLGFLLKETGQFDRAAEAYREALKTRTALLGPSHHDTIATQHNMVELLYARGDEAGAKQLQDEILKALNVSREEAKAAEEVAASGNAGTAAGTAAPSPPPLR